MFKDCPLVGNDLGGQPFPMSTGRLAFFPPVPRRPLTTFAFPSIDQGAGGRRIRGQLWSQTWTECRLGHLAVLWDSGHVTEPVSRYPEKIPIYRIVVGIKRKNACVVPGTGEALNKLVPFIL